MDLAAGKMIYEATMFEKFSGPNAYWSQPIADLLGALQSSAGGLASADAGQRLEVYGPNMLEVKEKTSALRLFLNQFKSPIVLILLFATVVSAVVQEWVISSWFL
jgi:Mg2+-importing ATPase